MVRPTHLEDPEQSLQAVLPSTSASERLLVSRSDCARTTPVRLEAVMIRRGWFVFRSDNWTFDSPRRDATAIIDSSSTTPNADHRAIVAAIVGWSRGNDLCRCSSSPSVGRRPCPVSSPCPCPVSLQQHAMNLCQSLLLLHCHSWPIRASQSRIQSWTDSLWYGLDRLEIIGGVRASRRRASSTRCFLVVVSLITPHRSNRSPKITKKKTLNGKNLWLWEGSEGED